MRVSRGHAGTSKRAVDKPMQGLQIPGGSGFWKVLKTWFCLTKPWVIEPKVMYVFKKEL